MQRGNHNVKKAIVNMAFMRRKAKAFFFFKWRTVFFLWHYFWYASDKFISERPDRSLSIVLERTQNTWTEQNFTSVLQYQLLKWISQTSVFGFTVWNYQDIFFPEAKLGGISYSQILLLFSKEPTDKTYITLCPYITPSCRYYRDCSLTQPLVFQSHNDLQISEMKKNRGISRLIVPQS